MILYCSLNDPMEAYFYAPQGAQGNSGPTGPAGINGVPYEPNVSSSMGFVYVNFTGANVLTNMLSANITPGSSTSDVRITACTSARSTDGGGCIGVTILRNGTNLAGTGDGTGLSTFAQGGVNCYTPFSISYIDSPATTSSITYTLSAVSTNATYAVGCSGAYSSLFLEEIQT